MNIILTFLINYIYNIKVDKIWFKIFLYLKNNYNNNYKIQKNKK